MRTTIAFDLDGVIADSLQAYLDHFNKRYGVRLSKSKITTYRLEELPGLDTQKLLETLEVVFSDLYRILPIPGSIECLERYCRVVGKVPIISHRFGKNGIAGAKNWLDRYLREKYTLTIADPKRKVEIVRERNYFGMVEDNPDTALRVAEAGILSIVFHTPYNQSVKHPNIVRVYDWSGLEKVLTHLEECKR